MINIKKYSNGRASNFEHELTSIAWGTEFLRQKFKDTRSYLRQTAYCAQALFTFNMPHLSHVQG